MAMQLYKKLCSLFTQQQTLNNCYITACKNGELDKVKAALLLGCDVNYAHTEEQHDTGLIIAANRGESHLPILSTILQTQGVDVNKTDKGNATALMVACSYSNLGGVTLLCGAPGNLKDKNGFAAIHYAVIYNSLECLKILLQTDTIDVNLKNSAGSTAAMMCLIENRKEMFMVMMESAKVDVSIKNAKNKTLEEIARSMSDTEALRSLQTLAASKNTKREMFMTILECAKVDVSIKNAENKTLEEIARTKSDTEALKLLPGTMEHQVQTNMQRQIRRSKECPVCMDDLVPDRELYQCIRGHIICENCKPRIQQCPKCRGPMMGRAHDFEEFLAGN